jgi:2-haloacid dehalogenase
MAKLRLEYREGDARAVYDQISTCGRSSGVTEALRRLSEGLPLVIPTNTDDVHASADTERN